MTVKQFLQRAGSVTGKKIKYKLGAGGINPAAPSPANIHGECDCSGYVCWALGISRQTTHPFYIRQNGGWINTDAIVADANHSAGLFTKLSQPEPGALVVFPRKPPGRKVGHVGIVAKCSPTQVLSVLHCSSGNWRKGDAICATPPTVFQTPDAIFAWYEGLDA